MEQNSLNVKCYVSPPVSTGIGVIRIRCGVWSGLTSFLCVTVLPLDDAIASRAVISQRIRVGQAGDGNAFGAS